MGIATVIEAKEMIDKGEVELIDVRSPEEYKISHIKGARLLPLDELEQWIDSLDKDKTYLLQCRTGGRSGIAQAQLVKNGYKAINLVGGIMDWVQEGYEVEN